MFCLNTETYFVSMLVMQISWIYFIHHQPLVLLLPQPVSCELLQQIWPFILQGLIGAVLMTVTHCLYRLLAFIRQSAHFTLFRYLLGFLFLLFTAKCFCYRQCSLANHLKPNPVRSKPIGCLGSLPPSSPFLFVCNNNNRKEALYSTQTHGTEPHINQSTTGKKKKKKS